MNEPIPFTLTRLFFYFFSNSDANLWLDFIQRIIELIHRNKINVSVLFINARYLVFYTTVPVERKYVEFESQYESSNSNSEESDITARKRNARRLVAFRHVNSNLSQRKK